MAVQRLRIVDEAPADGQAPLDVVIDGLENGGQSITSVEVSTLFANQPATAELEGTVLKLGIPKGGDRSGRSRSPAGSQGRQGRYRRSGAGRRRRNELHQVHGRA